MGIIEFYTRVLKSLDVEVEDGYLKIPDGDSLISYTNNGIPLVLPEKHHISTLLSEDDNGKIIAVKQLFNVLDETVIRGDSVSLSKLKKLVKVRLSNRLNIIGKLLLMTAENKALQTKTPMLVNQFLMRLTEADNPNIKKIVDDGTIERWCKLYDSSFETNNLGFISIYVKKGGKIGSTKYNRVTTIKCPIYEELCVLEKGGRINGINLRNKDVTVFKILFEYLIEGISANGIITTGSNNKECPGFISLFGTYLTIMGKIQEVLKGVSGADQEWVDACYIDLAVSKDELSDLDKYLRELGGIPRESDHVKTKLRSMSGVDNSVLLSENSQATNGNHPVMREPVPEQVSDSASAIKKALYGNVTGVNIPMQQQPMMQQPMQQQPMMQQPMQQQPMMQQPMQQQPMMQQPMQQRPMMQQPMMQQQPVYQPSIGSVASVGAFGDGATQINPQYPPNSPYGR